MQNQAGESHAKATDHYREAKEFAEWSAKDRQQKRADLPELTPEQTKQMRKYLRIMQEYHAFNPDSDLDPETGKPRWWVAEIPTYALETDWGNWA